MFCIKVFETCNRKSSDTLPLTVTTAYSRQWHILHIGWLDLTHNKTFRWWRKRRKGRRGVTQRRRNWNACVYSKIKSLVSSLENVTIEMWLFCMLNDNLNIVSVLKYNLSAKHMYFIIGIHVQPVHVCFW